MGAMESLRWMEARLPEILKDLEAFVRRESPSGDLEGLEAAARFLEEAFGPSRAASPARTPPRAPSSSSSGRARAPPCSSSATTTPSTPRGASPSPSAWSGRRPLVPGSTT